MALCFRADLMAFDAVRWPYIRLLQPGRNQGELSLYHISGSSGRMVIVNIKIHFR